ncbi:hypothetical protein [Latilactobacillus sakei]
MQQIILLLAVGILAGILGAILGIGGGIILTPGVNTCNWPRYQVCNRG